MTIASPRLAYPFRAGAAGTAVVEQDSLDEYATIALFALRTPLGWRPEAPTFGIADPVLTRDPRARIDRALRDASPRLRTLTSEQFDGVTARVSVQLAASQEA
jgi:hypothetical protein